jgi:hypothetical protein
VEYLENTKFEKTCKELDVTEFEMMFRHLHGGIDEKKLNLWAGQLIFGTTVESGTFRPGRSPIQSTTKLS